MGECSVKCERNKSWDRNVLVHVESSEFVVAATLRLCERLHKRTHVNKPIRTISITETFTGYSTKKKHIKMNLQRWDCSVRRGILYMARSLRRCQEEHWASWYRAPSGCDPARCSSGSCWTIRESWNRKNNTLQSDRKFTHTAGMQRNITLCITLGDLWRKL